MFDLTPYRRNDGKRIAPYNPFREMEELERRLFGGFFGEHALSAFQTDITDQGDSYLLEADLPGFEKKDIHLDLSGDTLTVHAERRSSHEEKDDHDRYVHLERSYGSYSRSFDVSMIRTDEIKAQYQNGVLKLTMPKKKDALPEAKHLEIE